MSGLRQARVSRQRIPQSMTSRNDVGVCCMSSRQRRGPRQALGVKSSGLECPSGSACRYRVLDGGQDPQWEGALFGEVTLDHGPYSQLYSAAMRPLAVGTVVTCFCWRTL